MDLASRAGNSLFAISLQIVHFKERPWALRSRWSLLKSNHERSALSPTKNYRFTRKTKEWILNPAFDLSSSVNSFKNPSFLSQIHRDNSPSRFWCVQFITSVFFLLLSLFIIATFTSLLEWVIFLKPYYKTCFPKTETENLLSKIWTIVVGIFHIWWISRTKVR